MNQNNSPRKYLRNGIGLALALLIFFEFLIIHILISNRADLPVLIGNRSEAMFDLWSFQHFFSGIIIGSLLTYIGVAAKITWQKFLLLVLGLAFCWEATELTLESGLFGQPVVNWRFRFEHWGNRFISDPLLLVLGAVVSLKSSWGAWKSR